MNVSFGIILIFAQNIIYSYFLQKNKMNYYEMVYRHIGMEL